jgi:hypothetical protein
MQEEYLKWVKQNGWALCFAPADLQAEVERRLEEGWVKK